MPAAAAAPNLLLTLWSGVRPVPLEIHIQGYEIQNLEARMQASAAAQREGGGGGGGLPRCPPAFGFTPWAPPPPLPPPPLTRPCCDPPTRPSANTRATAAPPLCLCPPAATPSWPPSTCSPRRQQTARRTSSARWGGGRRETRAAGILARPPAPLLTPPLLAPSTPQAAEADLEPHLAACTDPALRHSLSYGVAFMHETQPPAERELAQLLFNSGAVQVGW